MSLIHRRLGPGMVPKGYGYPTLVSYGWHEVLRLVSAIRRTLTTRSPIWRND
jgi:hypothetical protein